MRLVRLVTRARGLWHIVLVSLLLWSVPVLSGCRGTKQLAASSEEVIAVQITPLPEPKIKGQMSLEETLQGRRSIRAYSDLEVDLNAISQLLWAAQGITDTHGYRTAPSAGALYPLELYLVTQEGVLHYLPQDHAIEVTKVGDFRGPLHDAALQQDVILKAPLVIVITAVYERTQVKYGPERSPRYVHLEAGHAAQNVLLQAVTLGLGAVPIGAFYDTEVQTVLNLPEDHLPLYLIPIGHLE